MMNGYVAMPAITILAYLAADIFKIVVKPDKYKHIPSICGLVGGILSVLCYLFWGGCLGAENVLSAATIGVVSGWAATGVNQTMKQNSTSVNDKNALGEDKKL